MVPAFAARGGARAAVPLPDLYETAQPVPSTRATPRSSMRCRTVAGARQRPARCCRPALGAALNNPRQYVQRFGFTADNVLQVGFDSVSVDRLLPDAGLPIWGRERPATLVLLSVGRAGRVRRTGSTADQPSSAEREIVSAGRAAARLAAQVAGCGSAGSSQRRAASLRRRCCRQPRATARMRRCSAARRADRCAGRWRRAMGSSQASGGLDEGVHLAADTFARVYAASGSSLDSVSGRSLRHRRSRRLRQRR